MAEFHRNPSPVDDDATQALLTTGNATLASILAKILAAPSTEAKQDAIVTALGSLLTELGQKLEPADIAALATGAKQDTGNTALASILAKISSDPATQTTLAAVLAKLTSDPSTGALQTSANTKLDTLHTDLAAVLAKLIASPATEATLASILAAAGATSDASSALTQVGLLKAIKAAVTSTLLVESTRVSKGYQQVTSTAAAATLASLCSGAAIPTGATHVELYPSAPIRIRDDGTNPTASVGIAVGTNGFDYDRDLLSALKVYGAATIDCWFYA